MGERFRRNTFVALVVAAFGLAVGCSDSSRGSSKNVIEKFASTEDADPVTTAAWSLDGRPGLFATYGFGGSGTDGALTVSGTLVLDSSDAEAGPPGPDGCVAWNFSRLTVEKNGKLLLTGAHPIRLNVMGTCLIEGTIDASGLRGANAPAGTARTVGILAGGRGGPGGGVGGDGGIRHGHQYTLGVLPMDIRAGPGYPPVLRQCGEPNRSANRLLTVIEDNCGGGTGGNRGHPESGRLRSGCSGNGGGHASSGHVTDARCGTVLGYGDEPGLAWAIVAGPGQTETPTAGAGGGGGGNAVHDKNEPAAYNDIMAGTGGGGGGALAIECAGALMVAAGGKILANGGDGGIGHSTLVGATTVSGGYGGGGAGGSIWLSGTSVVVESGATVTAVGGVGNPSPPSQGIAGDGGVGYAIIRDLAGTPIVEGLVAPTAPSARHQFAPAANGTSYAVSRWIDGGSNDPAWAFDASDPQTGAVIPGTDLAFANPPTTGQSVHIEFQAAWDKNGEPDPDTTHWWPPGNTQKNPHVAWETNLANIVKIGGGRWLRYRVRFDLGEVSKTKSLPNRVVLRSIRIRR